MNTSVSNTQNRFVWLPDLILDYLVVQQLILCERKVKVVADETRVLSSGSALYIGIRISKSYPATGQP